MMFRRSQHVERESNHSVVKFRMVIRAKAQDIGGHVRPVVRAAQRANMVTFGVTAAAREFEGTAADLTFEPVPLLHALGDGGVAQDAVGRRERPIGSRLVDVPGIRHSCRRRARPPFLGRHDARKSAFELGVGPPDHSDSVGIAGCWMRKGESGRAAGDG